MNNFDMYARTFLVTKNDFDGACITQIRRFGGVISASLMNMCDCLVYSYVRIIKKWLIEMEINFSWCFTCTNPYVEDTWEVSIPL